MCKDHVDRLIASTTGTIYLIIMYRDIDIYIQVLATAHLVVVHVWESYFPNPHAPSSSFWFFLQ